MPSSALQTFRLTSKQAQALTLTWLGGSGYQSLGLSVCMSQAVRGCLWIVILIRLLRLFGFGASEGALIFLIWIYWCAGSE